MSPALDRSRGLRDIRWSGTLVTSLLAIAIAIGAIAAELPSLFGAVSTPSWSDDGTDAFAAIDAAHRRQAEVSVRRFSGRSPFELPTRPGTRPAPRAPRPEPRPTIPNPEPPKVDPGPPATYTGPKPAGVAAELVFFENGDQILVGEEQGGVTVLAILSARKVRLGHKGGEYEVDFLAGNGDKLFEPFRPGGNRVLGDPPASRGGDRPVGYRPSAGDHVTVVATINGARREITGRIESISGTGGRSMRIVPDDGGPARTITQSQLVEIAPAADGDAASRTTTEDASEVDDPETEASETEEEPEDENLAPIPPPISEEQFRTMSVTELEAAYPPRAHALERTDLDPNTVVRLQNELTIIHDLLRPPSNP